MSDALNLAMRITAADMFSGVMNRLHRRILGAGHDADNLSRHYADATRHIAAGIKSIAVASYGFNKIKPGITAAGDLQESLLNIKQLLWQSGSSAQRMAQKMALMRNTAIQVSSNLPFSATDLANIEKNLLQGGVKMKAVAGKNGAAFATAMLAAVGNMAPETVSESIAKIGHAFQLRGKQYSQGADTLARVSSSSSANLGELLYNLRQSGPAAHALNISLADTSVALGSVAALGQESGTALNQFFIGLAGASRRGGKTMKGLGLSFFEKGKFIGLHAAIVRLRKVMTKLPDDQARFIALQRLFGTEGARAARLITQTGGKSFEEIKKNSLAAAGLAEREKIWSEGLNASLAKLGGTTKSTLANLFDPLLAPLRELVDGTNQMVGNIGKLAGNHKGLGAAFSYGASALVAGAGAYGAYRLARGGLSALKVVRGLRGANTAAGIAKGKAIEAATGVQSVYVVNMPSSFGAGGAVTDAAAIAAGSGGGILSKIKKAGGGLFSGIKGFAGKLYGTGVAGRLAGAGTILSSGVGTAAAGVAIAGAAGYGAGTLINKYAIDDTSLGRVIGNAIGEGLNEIAAMLGSKESKLAIEINSKGHAKVTHIQAAKGQRIDVDTGLIPVGG